MKLATALATTQAALLAGQFDGGFLRLFSGSPPTSPDRAETGTLLGIVTTDGLGGAGLHFAVSGAQMNKADGNWLFRALATGTVGWFRLVTASDTGGNDLTALRIDGTVGTPTSPGDMQWSSLSVSNGGVYTIDNFVYLIQPVGIAP